MGLAEKRAAKDFQDKKFPAFKEQIDGALGFEVVVEVHWDQLCEPEYGHLYEEAWSKIYFQPLIAALASITADDLGKEALQGALKKIVIQNQAGIYSGDKVATFAGGTLTIDHQPVSNIDDVKERTQGITKTLENAL